MTRPSQQRWVIIAAVGLALATAGCGSSAQDSPTTSASSSSGAGGNSTSPSGSTQASSTQSPTPTPVKLMTEDEFCDSITPEEVGAVIGNTVTRDASEKCSFSETQNGDYSVLVGLASDEAKKWYDMDLDMRKQELAVLEPVPGMDPSYLAYDSKNLDNGMESFSGLAGAIVGPYYITARTFQGVADPIVSFEAGKPKLLALMSLVAAKLPKS